MKTTPSAGQRVVRPNGQIVTIVKLSPDGRVAFCRPDSIEMLVLPYPVDDLRPVEPRDNDTGAHHD